VDVPVAVVRRPGRNSNIGIGDGTIVSRRFEEIAGQFIVFNGKPGDAGAVKISKCRAQRPPPGFVQPYRPGNVSKVAMPIVPVENAMDRSVVPRPSVQSCTWAGPKTA
jgi:hypothetical protein